MLDFTELIGQSMASVTLPEVLITILLSVILGGVISATYKLTTESSEYSKNFFLTLILIPAVIAAIILLIGSNVARAFSLAGAFSIIRFRSAPGNPKDITYVLFSMAAGLACGVGAYLYAVIFTVVLCVLMVVFYKMKLGETKKSKYSLKITIPESLNFKGVFDEILQGYTTDYKLNKVKTVDMGSLFELSYSLTVKDDTDIKEFIDKIRCRNGNLTVLLSMAESNTEF
jgi:uncharacterized membrane protein YagU involved in acid resistance